MTSQGDVTIRGRQPVVVVERNIIVSAICITSGHPTGEDLAAFAAHVHEMWKADVEAVAAGYGYSVTFDDDVRDDAGIRAGLAVKAGQRTRRHLRPLD